MADDVIAEHPIFKGAAEFLAALRPGHPLWGDDPGAWVFRGHAESTWRLVPSGNRRRSLAPYFGTKYQAADPSDHYCAPEPSDLASLMVEFVYALGRAGHNVPGTPFMDIERVAEMMTHGLPSMIGHDDNGAIELIALAQHHELPTFMLDWTRHSNVAAYFAASDTVNLPGELAGEIEVWALNRHVGNGNVLLGSIDGEHVQLRVATPLRGGNPNLHAQSGLFTYNSFYPPRRGGAVHAADEIVAAMAAANPQFHPALPLMHRLRLPQNQAGEVLRLLSFEPVTGATLFPGVGGVVRDVRERVRLGRRD
jgi:hypothetical protein